MFIFFWKIVVVQAHGQPPGDIHHRVPWHPNNIASDAMDVIMKIQARFLFMIWNGAWAFSGTNGGFFKRSIFENSCGGTRSHEVERSHEFERIQYECDKSKFQNCCCGFHIAYGWSRNVLNM